MPVNSLKPGQATPVRASLVWSLVAAITAASVGIAWIAMSATDDTVQSMEGSESAGAAGPVPTPTPTPRPTETSSPVPVGGEFTPIVAENALDGFLAASGGAVADPSRGVGGLASVASGPIVEEIANEQAELASNGWTKVGTEKIASITVTAVSPEVEPDTATVAACIDSSEVSILDAAGKPIASSRAVEHRSLNIYSLTMVDGQWQVTDRSFPDNAAC